MKSYTYVWNLQLNQSREKERDLEREIGSLIQEKRELWKRCLDLENCLEEFKGTVLS